MAMPSARALVRFAHPSRKASRPIRVTVAIAVGASVIDAWWPERIGRVIQRGKRTARVRWSDGAEWTYDEAHERAFLRIAA